VRRAVAPSAVAAMVVVPGATAVTSPKRFTVATRGFALVHVVRRFGRSVPSACVPFARSGTVRPVYSVPAGPETVRAVSAGQVTVTGIASVTGRPSAPCAVAVASKRPAAVAVTVVSEKRTARVPAVTRTNGFGISRPSAA